MTYLLHRTPKNLGSPTGSTDGFLHRTNPPTTKKPIEAKTQPSVPSGKIPGTFLNAISRSGEGAIRLLGSLLATPFTGAGKRQVLEAGKFVSEPFKTNKEGIPMGASLGQRIGETVAKSEGGKPSIGGTLAGVTGQVAEGFGDPVNILLGYGSLLSRTAKIPGLAESVLGSVSKKVGNIGKQNINDVIRTRTINFAKPQSFEKFQPKGSSVKAVNSLLRSVEERFKSLGTPGAKIVKRLKESDTVGILNTGKVTKLFKDSGVSKLSRVESDLLGDALRGISKRNTLPEKVKKVYDFLDVYRQSVAQRAVELKLKVRASDGRVFDFPETKPNYFPQQVPPLNVLKKGRIRSEVVENAVKLKRFESIEESEKALDSFLEIAEKGSGARNSYFAEKLVAEGQAKNINEAFGKMLRFFKKSRIQRYGNLEYAREFDNPFFDPNPVRAFSQYINNVERRLADVQVLGTKLEKIDRLAGVIRTIKEKDEARALIKVSREATESIEKPLVKMMILGRNFSTLRLNPLSTLTNLGQNINSLLASDAPTFLRGIARSLTKTGRGFSLESGAVAPRVLRYIKRVAGGEQALAGHYLKSIGFTGAEVVNRSVAANVGFQWVQKMAKVLLKNPNNKFAQLELRALELSPGKIIGNKGLSYNDLLRAGKVFSDRTQFRSRPIDLPSYFTSSEMGKFLTQFKTFAFQQGRFLAQQTVSQAKSGNIKRALRNILVLSTVFPLTGEAIADLRALVQGRERESKGLERYFENLAYVGGFGLAGDTINALRYGEKQIYGYLGGPTVGLLVEAVGTIFNGVTKGKLTDFEKRRIIEKIPALGPVIKNWVLPVK